MNEKNTDYLIQTYPTLFYETMSFDCGDGWLKIIDGLAREISTICKNHNLECKCCDVKEKYATLRFYVDTETDEISNLIKKAEAESAKICENCGAAGKCRGRAWYYTRCEKCWQILKEI